MDWPPKFPDLNPIENLFELMIQQWDADEYPNDDAVVNQVLHIWDSFRTCPQLCEKLVASMPETLQTVIQVNGELTLFDHLTKEVE